MHGYLVYLTRDRDAAEDLTAETFEKALRHWRRFDPRRGSARTWLCQPRAHDRARPLPRRGRRRRRESAYAAASRSSRRGRLFGGLSPALERALAALSAGEREVIALRVLLDLDAETAARVLGISADRLLDPAEPRAEEARREDERRCRSLTTSRSSTRSARRRSRRPPSSARACARSRRLSPAAPPRQAPRAALAAALFAGGAPAAVAVALAVRSRSGSPTPVAQARRRQRQAGQADVARHVSPVLRRHRSTGARRAGWRRRRGGGRHERGVRRQPPRDPGRAQLYDAELTLKIKNLSTATKRALRLTRTSTATCGASTTAPAPSGARRTSSCASRSGSVQEAIVKFSALGDILDQHVSIQDVQPTVDKRFRQMQAHARPDHEAAGEARRTRRSPRRARRARRRARRQRSTRSSPCRSRRRRWPAQTSFATVELDLRQAGKAVVVPHDPSRIGQRAPPLRPDPGRRGEGAGLRAGRRRAAARCWRFLALARATWRRRAEAHLLSRVSGCYSTSSWPAGQ